MSVAKTITVEGASSEAGWAGPGRGRTVHVKVLPKENTDSGWFAILEDVPPANDLRSTIDCDWLVVGGGWMGLHAVCRLAELHPDAHVVLVDAGRIGNSAGGRSAGFAIDLAHNPRNKDFVANAEENLLEARVNRVGIAYLQELVGRFSLDCDWSPEGKIHAAASKRGEACLRTFADALDRIGEPYESYTASQMQEIAGTGYYTRGLYTPGTVLLQPAAYLRGVAAALPDNVTVYENSPVTGVVYDTPRHICTTTQGELRARKLVLANNGFLTYFGFHGGTAIPVYTYGSLTRPLTDAEQSRIGGRCTYGLIPADSFGSTVRRTADNRLFIRNVYAYAPGFQSTMAAIEKARARHQHSFDQRFPSISSMGFEHSWGGGFCLAQNGGMVFGELTDRTFGVAFCNGTGVARGAAFGKAIAEYASGITNETIEILRNRVAPSKAYPCIITEMGVRFTTGYRLWRAGREV